MIAPDVSNKTIPSSLFEKYKLSYKDFDEVTKINPKWEFKNALKESKAMLIRKKSYFSRESINNRKEYLSHKF